MKEDKLSVLSLQMSVDVLDLVKELWQKYHKCLCQYCPN